MVSFHAGQRADAYGGRVAYDEALAERVRSALAGEEGVTERKMFGGIAFMVGGNMAVGVTGDELMVRLDPAGSEKALTEEGVRVFDMTGRPMKGWILVSADRTSGEAGLAEWVEAGADYAASLPPK
jgi:TfoX/Sxy family transcriptional regulator of competence genes